MTLPHVATSPVEHVWAGREVPIAYLVDHGNDLEHFVHLTPWAHPMHAFVIGFAGCPRWQDPGHVAGGKALLTLWLSPVNARCSACGYLEDLAAFLARMGWEEPR